MLRAGILRELHAATPLPPELQNIVADYARGWMQPQPPFVIARGVVVSDQAMVVTVQCRVCGCRVYCVWKHQSSECRCGDLVVYATIDKPVGVRQDASTVEWTFPQHTYPTPIAFYATT